MCIYDKEPMKKDSGTIGQEAAMFVLSVRSADLHVIITKYDHCDMLLLFSFSDRVSGTVHCEICKTLEEGRLESVNGVFDREYLSVV